MKQERNTIKNKIWQKNPFSRSEIELNELNSNLELTGIVNSKVDKFALVSYLDNEGAITQESIGGVSTNLLPEGAKVINIDTQNMQISINYKNETFIIELQN